MLLHSRVAMVKHFDQFGPFRATGVTRSSNLGVASLVQIRMYALVQISYVRVSPNIKIGISPNFW